MTTSDPRSHLALVFRLQAPGCRHSGSHFYGDLCELLGDDAERGGAVIGAMGQYASEPFEAVYHLRLLAGLHRLALSGEAPGLRAHYPSTGGDGDAAAAWRAIEPLLRDPPATLLAALERPCQTNEVGRAAPLASGMAVVAEATGLPLRLLEIGSSAALNLRLDRYYYEAGGQHWGDPHSTVRFVNDWDGGVPPFATATPVVARRGCDIAPIDVTTPDVDVTLLSFVWPGQPLRFDRLRAALEIARSMPVDVDEEPVETWLPRALDTPVAGAATVVFHSVVWQYLPKETRDIVRRTLDDAGRRATPDAPLAWVRLEPSLRMLHSELRYTLWPGGAETLLATAGFHAGPISWLG